jgi:hypothetical protein
MDLYLNFLKLLVMKRITFFTVSILCIAACNNEIINNDAKNPTIELRMPDATKVSVYSVASDNENAIDKIWVLEFNSSNALINSELIDGSKILNPDNATQLLPQLKVPPTNGNRIVCIANSDATTYPHPDVSSINYTNINNYFPMNKAYYSGGDHLPMYGEILWSLSSSYTCEMTRAVAKIQIQMGTSDPDATGNFTAENVSFKIYDAGLGGYIQTSASVQGKPQSTTGQATKAYFLSQKNGATPAETNVYIHEYPTGTQISTGGTVSDNKTFHKNRQHIILEKTIGADTTYYRLDFHDVNTKEFTNTRRNHHYIFNIQEVRSEGYSRLEDAHNYPGSNIEYTITINDESKSATSNGQYAIITSIDTAYITSTGAVSDSIIATARYQLPPQITALAVGTTNSVSATSATPSGSMTSSGISALTATNGDIKVTASNLFTEGVITLKLGNITHRLYVKRKP